MDNTIESNENGWSTWAKHVLAEIKRGNQTNERLECKIDELNKTLIKHDVFIQEAKDKDIILQVSDNSRFRSNTNKLIWKVIGVAIGSAGGITALVNYISQATK